MTDKSVNKEMFEEAQRLYGCIVLARECQANGNNAPDLLGEELMDAAEELANHVIELFIEPACRDYKLKESEER